MSKQQKPQPMTADQARTFENGYSLANAAQLTASLACDCQPYVDIFTYRRWKAQGYQVQRGQKAQKITVYKPVRPKDAENDEPGYTIPKTSHVFCRCQVKEIARH